MNDSMRLSSVLSNMDGLRRLGRKIGFRAHWLLIPASLSLLSTLFDGISVALLMPAVQGLITQDFSFLTKTRYVGEVLSKINGLTQIGNGKVFLLLILTVYICVSLKNVFSYVANVNTLAIVRHSSDVMRQKIFERFLSFGKLYFDQNNAGEMQNILLGSTQGLAGQFESITWLLASFFQLIIYLAILLLISWKMTLLIMVLFPVLHFSLKFFITKVERASVSSAESYQVLSKKIANSLNCMPLIKATSNEERERSWFSFTSRSVRDCETKLDRRSRMMAPVQENIAFLGFLVLVIIGGLSMLKTGSQSFSSFVVYFVALRRATGSFDVFGRFFMVLAVSKGMAMQILEVFDDEKKAFVFAGSRSFEKFKGSLRVEELNFSYQEDNEPVLKNVSFELVKGQRTAIVGKSGSGKTTLVNMLMRFYDCPANTIFIDDTDIRDFNLSSLHQRFALVSQDTYILDAPLLVNLCYGISPVPSLDDVWLALERAQLAELVKKMSNGLETEIGDRGVKLSGGERQRLSIARAILRNADIVILDEATSALDTTTERLVQSAIDDLLKDRTTLVIAHRLSTIQNADQILVLDKGCIVEKGTFDFLIKNDKIFGRFWRDQARSA